MFRQAVLPRKRNRFAHALEELGSRILRDALKPCEILPNEAKLGRELGASRTLDPQSGQVAGRIGLARAADPYRNTCPGIDPLEPARSRCLGLALYRDAAIAIRS